MRIFKYAALFAVVLLPYLAGCENQQTRLPELVEIHGQILLDGQPVPGTKVVFIPDGDYIGSKWFPAYGTTNDMGEFQLKLRNGKKGAYSGWHRIFVSHIEDDEDTSKVIDPLSNAGFAVANPSGEVYPSYYNRESDLRFEVKKDRGILRPTFELSSIDPILIEGESE